MELCTCGCEVYILDGIVRPVPGLVATSFLSSSYLWCQHCHTMRLMNWMTEKSEQDIKTIVLTGLHPN